MKKLTIRLEKETHIALKQYAAQKEVSMSELIKGAILNVLAIAEDAVSTK